MSVTTNVLRYSALALGLFVGLKTDRRAAHEAHEASKLHQKEQLIQEAKESYAKLHAPPASTIDTQDSAVKFNLEDPKADFAQFILSSVESLEKA